jgi:hypothetical protein
MVTEKLFKNEPDDNQDNQQKPCDLLTDLKTTNISKTIYPLFFKGGIKINK